jgi:hypothetical protein
MCSITISLGNNGIKGLYNASTTRWVYILLGYILLKMKSTHTQKSKDTNTLHCSMSFLGYVVDYRYLAPGHLSHHVLPLNQYIDWCHVNKLHIVTTRFRKILKMSMILFITHPRCISWLPAITFFIMNAQTC